MGARQGDTFDDGMLDGMDDPNAKAPCGTEENILLSNDINLTTQQEEMLEQDLLISNLNSLTTGKDKDLIGRYGYDDDIFWNEKLPKALELHFLVTLMMVKVMIKLLVLVVQEKQIKLQER